MHSNAMRGESARALYIIHITMIHMKLSAIVMCVRSFCHTVTLLAKRKPTFRHERSQNCDMYLLRSTWRAVLCTLGATLTAHIHYTLNDFLSYETMAPPLTSLAFIGCVLFFPKESQGIPFPYYIERGAPTSSPTSLPSFEPSFQPSSIYESSSSYLKTAEKQKSMMIIITVVTVVLSFILLGVILRDRSKRKQLSLRSDDDLEITTDDDEEDCYDSFSIDLSLQSSRNEGSNQNKRRRRWRWNKRRDSDEESCNESSSIPSASVESESMASGSIESVSEYSYSVSSSESGYEDETTTSSNSNAWFAIFILLCCEWIQNQTYKVNEKKN